ncbi:hypothetical protein [Caballeronia sp. GAFFF1]|uniref:hypothetical protein n=1 Tax=Caballeronia sp. GAFFF1 TaxID=2921779 RepID=UPI002028190A|nr:hypothetical protein [Caballeronia sp. GAFFF1]
MSSAFVFGMVVLAESRRAEVGIFARLRPNCSLPLDVLLSCGHLGKPTVCLDNRTLNGARLLNKAVFDYQETGFTASILRQSYYPQEMS